MKKIKKVIVIVGPTATGKTELAVSLAEKLNTYIISGDSMQIYKHFHIGTAQPNLEQIKVPYFLVNILEPEKKFSAYDFKEKANEIIEKKQQIPIIAGGTGFYINSFLRNDTLGFLDGKQYQQFLSEYGEYNLAELAALLEKNDQQAFNKVDIANKRRVLRALAIKTITGKSIVEQDSNETEFDPFLIGLNTKRPILYERIEKRVDLMMEQGLLSEAEKVYENRFSYPLLSTAIGYKEFFPFFEDKLELSDSVTLLKQKTRNYAKRQLTWFRNKMQVNWYDIEDPSVYNKIESDLLNWFSH
ncbi:tRNA (adenosine(37)-N6)-dimethylallyltransferase MiaA [Xylocopilactobacillus apis]|uniref:tRNA dimethylallyltransferase n=1 Tax=Xylocopilactobacillus apis TaxID=2932183 RepID=A0AAU9D1G4_9LACO|nr:tRNA (adenosine(37)-N6)-dimethylallyltransferase MiaA [Xylocopilactobacillus apis]BDR56321.1 tRNA dimethylallyltransferase [Xylocopilactobacillus apis]